MKKIGIICAMTIESEKIIAEMKNRTETKVSGIPFTRGIIGNVEVILCIRGIGKVFAGMYTEAMIVAFSPDCIINTGVGGGLEKGLNIGDIVLADELCQYDVDTSAVGDPIGMVSGVNMIYFPADKNLNNQLQTAAEKIGINTKSGIIATGDKFISTDDDRLSIKDKFNASVCEMEGCAVAQVCYVNNVPCAVLRAISDCVDGNVTIDYPKFAAEAAKKASDILISYFYDC